MPGASLSNRLNLYEINRGCMIILSMHGRGGMNETYFI